MNLEKKTLGETIAKEYAFNGIIVKKEVIVETVNRLVDIIENAKISSKEQVVSSFFDGLRLGKLGVLHSNPMDLVYKFNQYVKDKTPTLSV